MTYATLADLVVRAGEKEILQIADRDRDGVADPDVIEGALANAAMRIDGYVGVKFDLPLPSVPALVQDWAVSIARYVLHRNGAPAHVRQDYDDAIAALKDVAAGRIILPVALGDPAPASSGAAGTVMASHPDQVWTEDRLRGWR